MDLQVFVECSYGSVSDRQKLTPGLYNYQKLLESGMTEEEIKGLIEAKCARVVK